MLHVLSVLSPGLCRLCVYLANCKCCFSPVCCKKEKKWVYKTRSLFQTLVTDRSNDFMLCVSLMESVKTHSESFKHEQILHKYFMCGYRRVSTGFYFDTEESPALFPFERVSFRKVELHPSHITMYYS